MAGWIWALIGVGFVAILVVSVLAAGRGVDRRTRSQVERLNSYMDGRINSGKKPMDTSKF